MVAGRNVEEDAFEGFLLFMAFPSAVGAGWDLGKDAVNVLVGVVMLRYQREQLLHVYIKNNSKRKVDYLSLAIKS